MTADDLTGLLQRRPPRDEPPPGTLIIGAGDETDAVLAYFKADRSRRVVRLVIGDRTAGYLRRTDLYALFPPQTKGVGDGSGVHLPGRPPPRAYRILKLECPVPDCPAATVATTYYDIDAPPRREEHPDQRLRPAP